MEQVAPFIKGARWTLTVGAAPFINGCSNLQLQVGAAPFIKGATLQLEPNINTINALHDRQTYYERAVRQRDFNFRRSDMDAVNYNFDTMMYLDNAREEHVVTYREAARAARDFLDGIATMTQGRLPRTLISDNQLREILGKVDAMVKRNYSELAATHISHNRDMEMVTFAVDQQMHSLIVTFPAFIKNYKQPPLSLYEVETVPVPILDKNIKANSYSQVRIEKSYIAAGTDYYIQLRISELLMCKSIRHICYCEELFVIKHKSRHSCVSAMFYSLGPATITKNCKIIITTQLFHQSYLMEEEMCCWQIFMDLDH